MDAIKNLATSSFTQISNMESQTHHGRRCIIFKNNKFSQKYVGKSFTSWRCTIRACNALIHTNNTDFSIEEELEERPVVHNHEDKIMDLTLHKLKVACKKRGTIDSTTLPSDVVRSEMEALGIKNEELRTPELALTKHALWRTRAAIRRVERSKNIEEAAAKIKDVPTITLNINRVIICRIEIKCY